MKDRGTSPEGLFFIPHPLSLILPFWLGALGLAGLYLASTCYYLSNVPLVDPDEPRYACASRTMARSGSPSQPETLLIPMLNGKPRINKPPLFYWLVAVSDKVSGAATEFSARAPSIVLGLVMLLTTIFLGQRVFGGKTGLLAGLILLSTPLFMALSRACITDMPLAAFMSAALGCCLLARLELAPPRGATLLAGVCLGLAMLTKATPALAVVLVIIVDRALLFVAQPSVLRSKLDACLTRFLPWLLAAAAVLSGAAIRLQGSRLDTLCNTAALACVAAAVAILVLMAWRSPRGAPERMPWGWGLGLALLLGLWWYAVLPAIVGWNEFMNLARYEIGERLAGSVHRRTLYYYLPVFLGTAFPWSIGIAGVIGAAWQATRCSARKTQAAGGVREAQTSAAAERFLLAWLLGIVLFFSIPGAKLASYILPAMPALALLTARFMVRVADEDPTVPRLGVRITLALAGLAGLALAGAGLCLKWLPREVQQFAAAMPVPLPQLAIQFALAIAGAWLLVWLGRAVAAALILAGSVVVLVLVLSPAVSTQCLEPRSTKQLCFAIADCQHVALLGEVVSSPSFYLDRPVLKSRQLARGEPYDAVISEELSKPERVALFISKGYYARAQGLKKEAFDALSPEELARSVPPGARFVGGNRELVVIANYTSPEKSGHF